MSSAFPVHSLTRPRPTDYCTSNEGLGSTRSYCTPRAFGAAFQPAAVMLEDVPSKYEGPLKQVLPDSVFTADDYLGNFTSAAVSRAPLQPDGRGEGGAKGRRTAEADPQRPLQSYMLFVGSILSLICLLIGCVAARGAYMLGAILSLLSALLLSIGLVIYTVIFTRVIQAIQDVQAVNDVDLGVDVELGNGLYLLWAAAGLMVFAILPFSIACEFDFLYS